MPGHRPLVLAFHGSADPAFGEVADALAAIVAEQRPDADVRVGYLDHGRDVAEVATTDSIVVPVLLTNGYHARRDLTSRLSAVVTRAVGPDRRLTVALAARLAEAGWRRQRPLALAAVGSADPRALADVHQVGRDLGDELGLDVAVGFLAGGEPGVDELAPAAVASYLLSPGRFYDALRDCGAQVVAAPLGAHPLLADIVLDRYATALG